MFSLILYCGLISFVVSKHFNIKDGSELDINTTLSTLASKTIPVSKDCVLEMKENEISQIVELFNSNLVNVVDIHISFSNSSQSERVLSDFHLTLWTNAGGEILVVLDTIVCGGVVPWTLEVGIRNFALNVKGSQKDCIKRGKNMTDFILKNAQDIVYKISNATNHETCASFRETSAEKAFKSFCKVTKLLSLIRLDSGCPHYIPWLMFYNLMSTFAAIGLIVLIIIISNDESERVPEYLRYYKSPSTSLEILWESQVVSFIGRFVFISVYLYSFNLLLKFVLGQYMCSLGSAFIFFIFVCLLSSTFFYRFCIFFHTFMSNTWISKVELFFCENNKYYCRLIKLVCQIICLFVAYPIVISCTVVFWVLPIYMTLLAVTSLMIGLFLNLIYFIPYFAFFSVLTFYCRTYWKTMEEKYFLLEQLIYEEIDKFMFKKRHPYLWSPKSITIKSEKNCYRSIRTCSILD